MKINIGVFAYNEQDNICSILSDIINQSLLREPSNQVAVYVLANGCTDNTVHLARKLTQTNTLPNTAKLLVLELPFSGKSRTWNYFIHHVCEKDVCDATIFIDGDIRIKDREILKRMSIALEAGPAAVINSKPIKDTELEKKELSFLQKIITSSGGSFTDFKSTICGQLYAARMSAIRDIFLPIGLPVEDGFIKAMVVSNFLTAPDDKGKITGSDDIWHEYESINSFTQLIRHQQRIIVGSAINTCIFREINKKPSDIQGKKQQLKNAAEQPDWLQRTLKKQLPIFPYGYVPFHFLIKRQKGISKRKDLGIPKKLLLSITGLIFDFLVYVAATLKLARGKGAGYW